MQKNLEDFNGASSTTLRRTTSDVAAERGPRVRALRLICRAATLAVRTGSKKSLQYAMKRSTTGLKVLFFRVAIAIVAQGEEGGVTPPHWPQPVGRRFKVRSAS